MYNDNMLEKDIIERINDKLAEYDGEEVYREDLAFKLFEAENMDGTATYSIFDAEEWVTTYFSDLRDYAMDYQDDFGEFPNPFENPEAFMVRMIIYIAEKLLWQVNLQEKFEITEDIANYIVNELNDKY